MSDSSKFHTVGIMLLASQHENKIPFNKNWISRVVQANTKIDWDEILSSGFIECYQDASEPLAPVKHDASPRARSRETETEAETEAETESPLPQKGMIAAPNGFCQFWSAYPKKVGRAKAEKSWKRIRASPDLLKLILSALEAHKNSRDWTKNNGEFIPHPASWLNQRRWEDELVSATETNTDWILETGRTYGQSIGRPIPAKPGVDKLPAVQAGSKPIGFVPTEAPKVVPQPGPVGRRNEPSCS